MSNSVRTAKKLIYRTLGLKNLLTLTAIYHLNHHIYEPAFHQFLSMIPTNGTLLDVGANVGITCVITKKERPDLHVSAFEPLPPNLAVLRRMQKLYSLQNIQIFPVALGETDSETYIEAPLIDGIPSTGLSRVSSARSDDSMSFRVAIKTLDSFKPEYVDAIKIDAENYEYHVLRGAQHILALHHPLVLCELMDNQNRTDTIHLMKSFGYAFQQLGEIDFLFTH
jgi:FkbM family methyltransferase